MKTKKILLVDDDVDVIDILTTILKKEGYEIVAANDKVDALKKAFAEKPDLAICDVMMTTHYEGFELAKEFSEAKEFEHMPVIMQTSIDVLTTTKSDVQGMAREFRKDPRYTELQVILLKDVNTGKAGIDYRAEDGRSIWLPVDGFLRKPVNAKELLQEVSNHIR